MRKVNFLRKADKADKADKAKIKQLEDTINSLTKARDAFQNRLQQRNEQNVALRQTIDTLNEKQKSFSAKLDATNTSNRRGLALERVEHFFKGKKLSLPQEGYEAFLEKCATQAPEKYNLFMENIENLQHRGIFEQLFSTEIDMAQGFNFRKLCPIVTFQRGSYDIDLAKKMGVTIAEQKAKLIDITKTRFDAALMDKHIDPKRVESICEIGAAWGAATRYMLNRYKPTTYHVYEIDTAWAQWLTENLGVDSKSCDGETFAETDDETMDIMVASSCLYFMPFVKQWNYLTETARVLRPGGLAFFNVIVTEQLTVPALKELLSNFFPRRAFGYIPQHCLDTAFPKEEFELLVENPQKADQYHIYRKL